jgi:aspartyl-tRNA(Asn)/glutamyl-tRNA(Gln) amidotransferase subunit C
LSKEETHKIRAFAYTARKIMVTLPAFYTPLWKFPEMTLKKEDVRKIAHLARLQIDDDAVDQYARDLSNVLALVEQMNEIDTSAITPMAHPLDATQRLREDEVTESNLRDKFQSIAPDVEKGLYRVPKVIE